MTHTDTPKKLVVVVHGVGQQRRFETVRAFIEGFTAGAEAPFALSRPKIAELITDEGSLNVDELPFKISEYCYSGLIQDYGHLVEHDPERWLRTVADQLAEKNALHEGPDCDFQAVDNTVDDVITAAKLGGMLASRVIDTDPVHLDAMHFIQQVQLYVDFSDYRSRIDEGFKESMRSVAEKHHGEIVLAAHSLGTVVALRALLAAEKDGADSWVQSVSRFATFGSPIDLILLLYPELFNSRLAKRPKSGIHWVNFTYGNDPIASDLAVARAWVENQASGLFASIAPDEVDLGQGSYVNAHLDYWNDDAMYREMLSRAAPTDLAEGGPASGESGPGFFEGSSPSGVFDLCGLLMTAVSAWLLLMWWEENIKIGDDVQIELLSNPVRQPVYWLLSWLMLFSCTKCFDGRRRRRAVWFCMMSAAALLLALLLPDVPILGGDIKIEVRYGKMETPWFVKSGGKLLILLGPLLGAIVGFTQTHMAPRIHWIKKISFLVITTVVLSLLVGTRDNPSNVATEFVVLFVLFATWWLAFLFARIHVVYVDFIGGRKHLDYLADAWNRKQHPREPRAIRRHHDRAHSSTV